jgi:TRAP transporter TAXI family solute receptor
MPQRFAVFLALIGLVALGVLISNGQLGRAQIRPPGRVAFQIATGSTAGTDFSIGQAIAGIVSHPPGVGRCETATVCGPAGIILSTRTSEVSMANLRMVNAGMVDSAIAQGDVIAQGVMGRRPFRRERQTHVRVIAGLFDEQVHLLAMDPKIQKVGDLRGKRVLLGVEGSGTAVVARQVLAAFGIPERRVKPVKAESGSEVGLLESGKIDALFTVAGAPLDSVRELLAHGAHLVPIDGEGRDRLVKAVPQLSPAVIADAYPATQAVQSVATRAYWITRDSAPDALIYGITRALFNPANRAALTGSHRAARAISLDRAAQNPPAPLHSGAARYYREMGKLPPS